MLCFCRADTWVRPYEQISKMLRQCRRWPLLPGLGNRYLHNGQERPESAAEIRNTFHLTTRPEYDTLYVSK